MSTKTPHPLGAPVTDLHGVGIRIEEKLNRLGIFTIQDLLFHLPLRYIDQTRITPIGALQAGKSSLIQGTIDLTQISFGRRRSLLCRISDGTGSLTLRFFYFSKAQQDKLQRNIQVRCFGKARYGANTLEMIHPEYQLINQETPLPLEEQLTPVYPTTEGLQQKILRKITNQALSDLEQADNKLTELLPNSVLSKLQLSDLGTAITYVHRPPPDASTQHLTDGTHPAQQRLAFEELLAQYLSLQRLRQKLRQFKATVLISNDTLIKKLIKRLPFELTQAQKIARDEIFPDLECEVPMLRLLQGDVGSGKTIVAALAILRTLESGYQAAIMAPTELLAGQHFNTFSEWFSNFNIPVVLLTSKLSKSDRSDLLKILGKSQPVVAIGTHALFQTDVKFSKLRLVVIDEQHRFGVHQRLALLDKGNQSNHFPHQLIMTATPIPRTLAMTAYADLDISVIDALPPGRKPVNTVVIQTSKRDEVITRIQNACAESRQAYWVCTLIEESESLQCEAAIETQLYLTNKLSELRVGLIHGKMKSSDKETVMAAFKSGAINLLVATTVIEVGVDVPNASLMIIENAERLGLFQLHQLRGRIGRGSIKSDCVLLYQPPLSEMARIRLDTLRNTNNGFEIAQKDLELRGPGELMGTRQTGLPALRIADLMRDAKMLPDVHSAANTIIQKHPEYIQPLIDRWLGKDMEYGKV